MLSKEHIADWFAGLQDRICRSLETADGRGRFGQDLWQRAEGGGGRTRTWVGGRVLAKAGVGFSAVHGPVPTKLGGGFGLNGGEFYATGVSLVMHPENPWVPIVHMNVRYFEHSSGTYWFGGGIDLTPHYVDEADARHFHTQLNAVCDRFHPDYYPQFKQGADTYFYLPHRGETRGVGGIFFDHLTATETLSKADRWAFVQAVGESFAPIYTHFMNGNANRPYGERELRWQRLRRGRYVEFNLVYDRGTRFGLETGGRTESILMSLPPQADWQYDYHPEPGSPEQATLDILRRTVDWV